MLKLCEGICVDRGDIGPDFAAEVTFTISFFQTVRCVAFFRQYFKTYDKTRVFFPRGTWQSE